MMTLEYLEVLRKRMHKNDTKVLTIQNEVIQFYLRQQVHVIIIFRT
jgi:hypothetical protein